MSLSWSQQLILVPVLLPLLCGAVLILINESRHQLKFALNFGSVLLLLAAAVTLMWQTDSGRWPEGIGVYLAANWSAPFGIALVVDRLAALMLLLTAILAICALLYSLKRWGRIGVHFHSLFQFMLMGLNGAFLTHDLFNLFVFFEVMLAASYGLLLHGYNVNRIRAGMQFVAINLVASLLFLIGVALIYANTGTLNMADVAARVAEMDATELGLLQVGMVALVMVFLIKSAMWPFGFWLPTTYSAASPPVAAMFVLMTKVGIYTTLRVWLLVFSDDAGDSAGFGLELLFWGGIVTIIFGAIGMLASEVHGQLAGYSAIVSSGTLLAAIGYGLDPLVPALLFYLISSTLAVAAFMLLIELIDRSRNPIQAMLELTKEAFEFEEAPDQPVGVGIPAAVAFLGLSFAGIALVIAGLPPLSGFIAKFSMFHAVMGGSGAGFGVEGITFIAVVILAGLATIISLITYGIRTFWSSGMVPARLNVTEVIPIGALLLACVLLTLYASPVLSYLERTGAELQQPGLYIEGVLSAPVVESQGGQQ